MWRAVLVTTFCLAHSFTRAETGTKFRLPDCSGILFGTQTNAIYTGPVQSFQDAQARRDEIYRWLRLLEGRDSSSAESSTIPLIEALDDAGVRAQWDGVKSKVKLRLGFRALHPYEGERETIYIFPYDEVDPMFAFIHGLALANEAVTEAHWRTAGRINLKYRGSLGELAMTMGRFRQMAARGLRERGEVPTEQRIEAYLRENWGRKGTEFNFTRDISRLLAHLEGFRNQLRVYRAVRETRIEMRSSEMEDMTRFSRGA